MILFTVLLPAVNFLLMIAFSRVVHWKPLAALIITSMVAELAYLISEFPAFVRGESHTAVFGSWVHSGLFEVNWTFSIDVLTYTMLIVVLTVSTLVHLYSTEYMSEDPHINRFISYLSLFTFFMLLLITADNFVNLFLGWEGVGLCSYLLISFWFTRIQANKAAIKAMVVNRVADLAFTIGMSALFYTFQTTEFNVVFGLTPYLVETTIPFCGGQVSPVTLTAFLLFLGAMGKSAQIGLHTWLPDAMEGPTPVSALIHAATMVTAGVFLLIRSSGLYEFAPSVLEFITVIGAATAFMAATSGLLQNDLKKVIAYSTCSQLGYMVFACGLSSYSLSLFHLANHAFFKALLFLSAGAVIHGLSNEQDMRRLGGLMRILPYTYAMFVIGSLALMGFPFLTGFYSKDLILESSASGDTIITIYAYLLGITTALFTAYYSLRLLNLVFYGVSRSPRTYLLMAHELTPRMAAALAVLSIGSIFFGYFFRDAFVGLGTLIWAGVILQLPEFTGAQLAGEFLALLQKMAPLFGCYGSALVIFLNETTNLSTLAAIYQSSPRLVALTRFLTSKWGFDAVYNLVINHPLLRGAYNITFSLIDKGVLEVFGPTGAGKVTYSIGTLLVKSQTGRVYEYAAFMVVAVYLTLTVLTYIPGLSETLAPLVMFVFLSPSGKEWRKTVIVPARIQKWWVSVAWGITNLRYKPLGFTGAYLGPSKPGGEWHGGPDDIPDLIATPGKVPPALKGTHGFTQRFIDKILQEESLWTPLYKGIVYLWEGCEFFNAYQAYRSAVHNFKAWRAQIEAYRSALKAATPSQHARVQADYARRLETTYTAYMQSQELFHEKYALTRWGAKHLEYLRGVRGIKRPDRLEWYEDGVRPAVEMMEWYAGGRGVIDKAFELKDSIDGLIKVTAKYVVDAERLNSITLDLANDLGFLSYAAGSVPTYFALPLLVWHILFYLPLACVLFLTIGPQEPYLPAVYPARRSHQALLSVTLLPFPLDNCSLAAGLLSLLIFTLCKLLVNSSTTPPGASGGRWWRR